MISQLQDSEDDIKNNGSIVPDKTTNALPKVTGFEHEWNTLLTTSKDLKNFEAKAAAGYMIILKVSE